MDKYGPDLLSAKVLPWAIRDFIIDQGGPESIRQSIWSEHFNKEYLKHIVRGASKETAIARAHTYCNLKVVEMAHKAGYLEKLETGKNSREARESEWIYVKSSEELKVPACAQNLAKESAPETMTTLNTPTEAGDKQTKPTVQCHLRKLFAEAQTFATDANYHLGEDSDAGDAKKITSMVAYGRHKYVVYPEIMQLLIGLWKFVTQLNRQKQDSTHAQVLIDSRQIRHKPRQVNETDSTDDNAQNMHLMAPYAGKNSLPSAIVHLVLLLRASFRQKSSMRLLQLNVSLGENLKVNDEALHRLSGRINLYKDIMLKPYPSNRVIRSWMLHSEQDLPLETKMGDWPCFRYKSNTVCLAPNQATRSWSATQFRLCLESQSTETTPLSSLSSADAQFILIPSSYPSSVQGQGFDKNSAAVSTNEKSVTLDTERVISIGRPQLVASMELLENSTKTRQCVLTGIKASFMCSSVSFAWSLAARFIEHISMDLPNIIPVKRTRQIQMPDLQLSSDGICLTSTEKNGSCPTAKTNRRDESKSSNIHQNEDTVSSDRIIITMVNNDQAVTYFTKKTNEYKVNDTAMEICISVGQGRPPDDTDNYEIHEPISRNGQDKKDKKKKKSLGRKVRGLFRCFICGRNSHTRKKY